MFFIIQIYVPKSLLFMRMNVTVDFLEYMAKKIRPQKN